MAGRRMKKGMLLSVRQPWAWLIVRGFKDIENRTWPARYIGPLFIHASRKFDEDGMSYVMQNHRDIFNEHMPKKQSDYTRGALVGGCDLVTFVREHPSEWFFGPWGFVLENAWRLQYPIVMRGKLGLNPVEIDKAKLLGNAVMANPENSTG